MWTLNTPENPPPRVSRLGPVPVGFGARSTIDRQNILGPNSRTLARTPVSTRGLPVRMVYICGLLANLLIPSPAVGHVLVVVAAAAAAVVVQVYTTSTSNINQSRRVARVTQKIRDSHTVLLYKADYTVPGEEVSESCITSRRGGNTAAGPETVSKISHHQLPSSAVRTHRHQKQLPSRRRTLHHRRSRTLRRDIPAIDATRRCGWATRRSSERHGFLQACHVLWQPHLPTLKFELCPYPSYLERGSALLHRVVRLVPRSEFRMGGPPPHGKQGDESANNHHHEAGQLNQLCTVQYHAAVACLAVLIPSRYCPVCLRLRLSVTRTKSITSPS